MSRKIRQKTERSQFERERRRPRRAATGAAPKEKLGFAAVADLGSLARVQNKANLFGVALRGQIPTLLRRILGISRTSFSVSEDFRVANGTDKVNCA